jgi:hypothetical protein
VFTYRLWRESNELFQKHHLNHCSVNTGSQSQNCIQSPVTMIVADPSAPDIVLRAVFILRTALRGDYSYYPHFMDE